jgi:hypothetical protein
MNKWHPTDAKPYIAVRWDPDEARPPILVDPARHLYLPRQFEAAIVTLEPTIRLGLQATAALREIYEVAGYAPPAMTGDAVIKAISVGTDAFSYLVPGKRIPFATYTKMAVAAATVTRAEFEEGGGAGTYDEWDKKVFFDELVRRRPGRPRLEENDGTFVYATDGTLVTFDEILAIRAASSTPTKAVMERFGVPRRTAQRWSKRALTKSEAW